MYRCQQFWEAVAFHHKSLKKINCLCKHGWIILTESVWTVIFHWGVDNYPLELPMLVYKGGVQMPPTMLVISLAWYAGWLTAGTVPFLLVIGRTFSVGRVLRVHCRLCDSEAELGTLFFVSANAFTQVKLSGGWKCGFHFCSKLVSPRWSQNWLPPKSAVELAGLGVIDSCQWAIDPVEILAPGD